jgi:hypothetical protein
MLFLIFLFIIIYLFLNSKTVPPLFWCFGVLTGFGCSRFGGGAGTAAVSVVVTDLVLFWRW